MFSSVKAGMGGTSDGQACKRGVGHFHVPLETHSVSTVQPSSVVSGSKGEAGTRVRARGGGRAARPHAHTACTRSEAEPHSSGNHRDGREGDSRAQPHMRAWECSANAEPTPHPQGVCFPRGSVRLRHRSPVVVVFSDLIRASPLAGRVQGPDPVPRLCRSLELWLPPAPFGVRELRGAPRFGPNPR